ncbi:hypothetical protein BHM03_00025621 [Ensete ventricosum]|uniref:Uncharacterized protein n=1 Tax=Ensete ventricosum TaxID=4639 RepID=A0A445MH65_ENSVE|nr:hypothetical protein BHM03_00025621 [Ensete ventricosum]
MAAKGGGNIRSTSINGEKLYFLSGQRSVATWLPPKKLRALCKDKGFFSYIVSLVLILCSPSS